MKKLSNLTKVVGAFALGALTMTGCKSKEAPAEEGGGDAATTEGGGDEAAAEGEGGSCGGEGKEGSCGGDGGSCGGK